MLLGHLSNQQNKRPKIIAPLQKHVSLLSDLMLFAICHAVLLMIHLLSFTHAMCPTLFHFTLMTCSTISVIFALCVILELWAIFACINVIIIIIIVLKGTIQDFYNLLTAPRTVCNTYDQVARAQSCANHVQHVKRLYRATCSVPLGTKKQLSY